MKACQCNAGCPSQTRLTFAQGHDAVYRERMINLLRTKLLTLDEARYLTVDRLRMPALFSQIEERIGHGPERHAG